MNAQQDENMMLQSDGGLQPVEWKAHLSVIGGAQLDCLRCIYVWEESRGSAETNADIKILRSFQKACLFVTETRDIEAHARYVHY